MSDAGHEQGCAGVICDCGADETIALLLEERDELRSVLDARSDHTAEEVGYAAVLARAELAEFKAERMLAVVVAARALRDCGYDGHLIGAAVEPLFSSLRIYESGDECSDKG